MNRKRNFTIRITETLVMDVDVEAETETEAKQIVSDRWHNADYILDADYFKGVEFEVVGNLRNRESPERDAR